MNQFGFFAKHWTPGQVKTRLAATIGEAAASQVYRTFIQTIAERFAAVCERQVLCITPPEHESSFSDLLAGSRSWEITFQQGDDLGVKMQHYFDTAFGAGAKKVVLIGSDSPTMPRSLIEQALAKLETNEVVLGPAEDQGYYLVAARDATPPIFQEISWSTADVWGQTIARLQSANFKFATLPTWYDIDVYQDLVRLQRELQNEGVAENWSRNLLVAVELALATD